VLCGVLAAAGCAAGASSPPVLELRVADGPRWVAPGDVQRYRCEQGLFVCTSGIGRLTPRLCQCVRE
jgi:hypothetical protein